MYAATDLTSDELRALIAAAKDARARDPAAVDGDALDCAMRKLMQHLDTVAKFDALKAQRDSMR